MKKFKSFHEAADFIRNRDKRRVYATLIVMALQKEVARHGSLTDLSVKFQFPTEMLSFATERQALEWACYYLDVDPDTVL